MVKFSPSLAAVVMRAQSLSPAALAQHYAQVNLESNVAGPTDSQLIHGWGPARNSGSAWWVSLHGAPSL
jgi:hypothetical protein